eukprot:4510244-Lingulodinium_polyedra.AAC.1
MPAAKTPRRSSPKTGGRRGDPAGHLRRHGPPGREHRAEVLVRAGRHNDVSVRAAAEGDARAPVEQQPPFGVARPRNNESKGHLVLPFMKLSLSKYGPNAAMAMPTQFAASPTMRAAGALMATALSS